MEHELYECIYLSVSLTQSVAQLRVASPGLWGIAPFEAHLKTMAQPHSAVWLRIAAQSDHMEGWK